MKKNRIAIFTHSFDYSGAEKNVRFLCDALSDRGYDITLIITKQPSDGASNDRYSVVSFHDIAGKSKRVWKIFRHFREAKYNIILSFNSEYNILAVMCSFFVQARVVVCERNCPRSYPASRHLRLLRNITYRFSDLVVCQTNNIAMYFKLGTACPVITIPNPSMGRILPPENRSRNNTIVCVGRLDLHQKDHETLLRAFHLFNQSNKGYTLEILGDGPDQEMIEDLIKELSLTKLVKLQGKSIDVKQDIYNAKLFVLSSIFEGMPNVVIESIEAGVPIVATNCSGGGSKYLLDGACGRLVECRNIEQLAQSIEIALNDYEESIEMACRAQVELLERCGIGRLTNLWCDALRNLEK